VTARVGESDTEALGRYSRRATIGWTVGFIVAAATIGGVFYFVGAHKETVRLAQVSAHLTTPKGWTLVDHFSEPGSGVGCVISCPHATVTAVFKTLSTPKDACVTVRAKVTREVAPARDDTTDPGCGWRAPLPSVSGAAVVRAGSETASVIRSWSITPWGQSVPPTGNDTYVWVVFSGGPT
jgi:hypothetical protein